MGKLDNTYIKVLLDGEWQRLSLQEMLDKGHGVTIVAWFQNRMQSALGLQTGEKVEAHHVLKMLEFLESVDVTIYMITEESNEGT